MYTIVGNHDTLKALYRIGSRSELTTAHFGGVKSGGSGTHVAKKALLLAMEEEG